jgi:succinate dehydrogenase / fumarate reductase iron-sulfur subunit
VAKELSDVSFAAAACIGCGACVAACKNSSAMLFVSAKISHLALLPQGAPERKTRAQAMVAQMDKEGFGSCTNTQACESVCPKEISMTNIARLNSEYILAGLGESS